MELSNAKRARLLSRLISHLMEQQGLTEVRVPVAVLENQADFGFVVENGIAIIALGDKPKWQGTIPVCTTPLPLTNPSPKTRT